MSQRKLKAKFAGVRTKKDLVKETKQCNKAALKNKKRS